MPSRLSNQRVRTYLKICIAAGFVTSALLSVRCLQQMQVLVPQDGMAWSLAATFFDVFVLSGVLVLARKFNRLELWRSSIGMYGSFWMWMLGADLTRMAADGVRGFILVFMGVGVGCLLILDHIAPRSLRSVQSDETGHFQMSMLKTKAGVVIGGLVWVRLGLDPGAGVSVLLMVFFVVFTVWLGLAQISLRQQLGLLVVLSGVATMLVGLICAFDGVFLFRQLAEAKVAAGIGQRIDDFLIMAGVPTITYGCSIVCRLLLVALLFYVLRGETNGKLGRVSGDGNLRLPQGWPTS